jgi:hypothetical protein
MYVTTLQQYQAKAQDATPFMVISLHNELLRVCMCMYVCIYIYILLFVCIYIYCVLVRPPVIFCHMITSQVQNKISGERPS